MTNDSPDAARPRFPATLAPPAYYSGLEDRLRKTLLPVLEPYLTAPASSSSGLRILELASGTGAHSVLFLRTCPDSIATVQPTECDLYGVRTIDGTVRRAEEEGEGPGALPRGKLQRAKKLDILDEADWEQLARPEQAERPGANAGPPYDLVFGSNFLHMVPFPEGPQRIFTSLERHGLVHSETRLIFYGPFRPSETAYFSDSDAKFDTEIRSRAHDADKPLGLRPLDRLVALAASSRSGSGMGSGSGSGSGSGTEGERGRERERRGWELEAQLPVEANGNWVLVFRPAGAAATSEAPVRGS